MNLIVKESTKCQYRRCQAIFGKGQMKNIDKIEFQDYGVVIQISTRTKVE